MIDVLAISTPCFTAINRELYRRLKRLGWKIEMVVPDSMTFPSGVQLPDPEMQEDPPIHFLQLNTNNPRIQSFKGLKRILKKLKPKVVYLDNDPGSLLAIQLGFWCKMNNSRLICQSCENLPLDLVSTYKREGFKGLISSALKNSFIALSKPNISHVFVINNDGLNIFRNLKFKSVSKTPLGFNEKIFYPSSGVRNKLRNQLGLKNITFAYFGRLVPEKGVHILIRSLGKIKDLDWQLVMDEFELYGSEYSKKIKALIESEGLQDRVVFINARHEEIADYMNAVDVVVIPSISTPKWKEQYGRVLPEAMACRKLVIISDSGALPELADDKCLKFKEGDEETLSRILRDCVLKPDLYTELQEEAFVRAVNYLSVKTQVEIVNKVLTNGVIKS
ncbi:MAG: glycosyltransferase family 4 protein [Bacteroidota bacterium]|nr:glycosyltransferase family 4 protein [Bacteroidota bacterium]